MFMVFIVIVNFYPFSAIDALLPAYYQLLPQLSLEGLQNKVNGTSSRMVALLLLQQQQHQTEKLLLSHCLMI